MGAFTLSPGRERPLAPSAGAAGVLRGCATQTPAQKCQVFFLSAYNRLVHATWVALDGGRCYYPHAGGTRPYTTGLVCVAEPDWITYPGPGTLTCDMRETSGMGTRVASVGVLGCSKPEHFFRSPWNKRYPSLPSR